MECLERKIINQPGIGAVKVPCGKCAFCLTNERSSWMFRIHHEMKSQSNPGWFLTLTYSEKFVKRVGDRLSLRFRDVQLFIKKVRKAKYYVKYICVGEYGAITQRPHYHLLLWTDCPVDKIENFWKMGSVHTGRLSMGSAMYVLKYIIQPKQKSVDGIERTRGQFSKGIGIGYLTCAVYEWHTAVYESPEWFSYIEGKKVALPKYYKDKIFTKYQRRVYASKSKWDCIRKRRKLMRKMLKNGVVDANGEINKIRLEQSNRLLLNCKINQSL